MQVAQACLENLSLHQFWLIMNNFPDFAAAFMFRSGWWEIAVLMVEFHGFSTLMVPIAFCARRVSKKSVISYLTAQKSEIIFNLYGLI